MIDNKAHELLAEVTKIKIAYLNQQATQEAVYQAAQCYINHLKARKRAEPTKFKRLHIPSRPQIVRFA